MSCRHRVNTFGTIVAHIIYSLWYKMSLVRRFIIRTQLFLTHCSIRRLVSAYCAGCVSCSQVGICLLRWLCVLFAGWYLLIALAVCLVRRLVSAYCAGCVSCSQVGICLLRWLCVLFAGWYLLTALAVCPVRRLVSAYCAGCVSCSQVGICLLRWLCVLFAGWYLLTALAVCLAIAVIIVLVVRYRLRQRV